MASSYLDGFRTHQDTAFYHFFARDDTSTIYKNDLKSIEYNTIYIFCFNAKEKDYESGYHYYGARYYDSEMLAGWLSIDPMADKYPSISPYAYCEWNPILFVDQEGREKLIHFETRKPSPNSYDGNRNAHKMYKDDIKQWEENIKLTKSANAYKDHKDVIHLFAHGSSHSINLAKQGRKESAQDLELFLINSSLTYNNNINEGKTSLVILHSCNTGKSTKDKKSIGQELSLIADMLVIAPSERLFLDKDEIVDGNGTWNVYYKGELVGKYNGSIDFQKQLEGKDATRVVQYWKNIYDKKHENL